VVAGWQCAAQVGIEHGAWQVVVGGHVSTPVVEHGDIGGWPRDVAIAGRATAPVGRGGGDQGSSAH
jgi:hypothetical protein